MERVKIGDTAKDFNLSDQDDNELQLSSLKRKRVLLSFHPLAWTKTCADRWYRLKKTGIDSKN